jgi:hypothetical protein
MYTLLIFFSVTSSTNIILPATGYIPEKYMNGRTRPLWKILGWRNDGSVNNQWSPSCLLMYETQMTLNNIFKNEQTKGNLQRCVHVCVSHMEHLTWGFSWPTMTSYLGQTLTGVWHGAMPVATPNKVSAIQ